MTNAKGKRAITSLLTAGLLAALVVTGGPLACGGSKGSSESKTAAAVPKDVASLSIYVTTDGRGDSDPHVQGAVAGFTQALSRAGYKVVEKEKGADAFARLSIGKQPKQSLFQVTVNGKTQTTYNVNVSVQLVDREGKTIESADGSYTSDEGEADADAITDIVNKLSASPVLAKYATDSKAERKARKKKEAKERKEAEEREASETARKQTEQEQREAKKRAEGTLREASNLEREINDIIRKAEGPIPEDKLKALRSLIDTLKTQSPNDARYYAQIQSTYTTENTWWMPEAEGPAALAKALSSDLAASGANDGKKLALTFNVKAGSCYTVFLRYRTPGGNEEVKDLAWSAKGGNTPLQRYHVSWGPGEYNAKGTQRTVGTCATKDTSVTLSANLIFAGTKNGLRYAVVSSPKDKFPLHLATYLGMDMTDACDTEAWAQRWLDPIPGTLVYDDKEPFLLGRTDRAGQLWVNLWSATRTEVRARKPELATAPPKKVKFSTQLRFPGCSKETTYAEGADSVRFAKCHAQIDAKYKAQWDAAERAKENAITFTGRRAAEAQLNRLDEADERDREQLCAPIAKQIEKKWEATFNKIVDSYTESPLKSPVDRAGELTAQDAH